MTPAVSATDQMATAEIPARADADEEFVRAALRRSNAESQRAAQERTLLDLSSGVDRLAQLSGGALATNLSFRTLDGLEKYWQFYAREVTRWHNQLLRLMQPSLDDGTEMERRLAVWRASRLAVAATTPALVPRVDETIGTLSQAESEVSASLARSLELAGRGNDLLARVEAERAEVMARGAAEDLRLLVIDSPPLWLVPLAGGARLLLALEAPQSVRIDTAFGRVYDAAHPVLLGLAVACAILALPLMLWLRGRAILRIAEGQATTESMHTLLRPWAAWIVLVAFVAVLANLQGPILRQETAAVLVWFPVLRLLRPTIRSTIGPCAYWIALCYFLDAFASLLLADEVRLRYLLLLIDMLLLVNSAWLRLRVSRFPGAGPRAPQRRLILEALLLGVAALSLVSIVSNIVGNVTLATMLTKAVLESSFFALLLFVGATISVATLRVLAQAPSASRPALRHTDMLTRIGVRLGSTLLFFVWMVAVLRFFRIYRPLAESLFWVFSYHFHFGSLSMSLGRGIGFGAAVYASFWLARTIHVVLAEDVLPSVALPRGLGTTISTLSYYAILFVGLIIALAIAGVHVSELAIVFGALGVGIGFGLQDIVKNFVSGLILMFERPIRVGDVVDIATMSGTVRDIGMRATVLITADGADVVIPNGMLLADKLVNWTLRGNRRRISITIVTSQDADAKRTLDLLVKVAGAVDGIAAGPPPQAILSGLGPGTLEFSLMAWTAENADWVRARSLLNVTIRDALGAAGIEIPGPQRELHLRSISKSAGEELAGLQLRSQESDRPISE